MANVKILVAVLLAAFLLFGCLEQQPANGLPAAKNTTQPGKAQPQANGTPAPGGTPQAPPYVPPAPENPALPPKNNSSAVQPQLAPQAPSMQVIYSNALRIGDELSFGEGSVRLDDVSGDSQLKPAFITISYPNKTVYKKLQILPYLEAKFVAETGWPYWIMVKDTLSPNNLSNRMAMVYVFSAKSAGEWNLNASKYAEIIGNNTLGYVNTTECFGRMAGTFYMNQTNSAQVGSNAIVRLADIDRYKDGDSSAAVLLDRGASSTEMAVLPVGHAYSFRQQDGKSYVIFNQGSGIGQNATGGNAIRAKLAVYEAGKKCGAPGQEYEITNPQEERKNAVIGSYELPFNALTYSDREFYMQAIEICKPNGRNTGFATLQVIDSDGIQVSEGIATPLSPMKFTANDGKQYSLWVESITSELVTRIALSR